MSDPASIHILIVEDNDLDARAILRSASKIKVATTIEVVIDGRQALDYLANSAKRPDLILLDLNLPGLDGHDVLSAVKGDPNLRRIPVIVVTTSANDADVVGAYDRGANAYVDKPKDLAGWQLVVDQIEAFWLSLARLSPT